MFIYRKEGALSPKLCNAFIESFESSDEKHPGVLYGPEGHTSEDGKKSTDLSFHPGYLKDKTWGPLFEQLIPILEQGLNTYITRHETAMQKMDPVRLGPIFNMQRYLPGEGFKSWHCERASVKFLDRLFVWMVYLNDVEHGGETEFFYQHHFEEPKQGKLVLWPSDWTHLHRGVIAPTETKYILTGWFTHYPLEIQKENVST